MSARAKVLTANERQAQRDLILVANHKAKYPMLPTGELVSNAFMLRSQFYSKLLDPRRNIDAECGYPDQVTPSQYRGVYDRQGLGTRIVSLYPEECWAMDPEVYEDEDPDTETPFEEAWNKLLKKHNLWHHLHRIDELSGIGHFGVLLLGFDDGKELSMPARDGTGDLEEDKPSRKEVKLLYVRSFDHSLCKINKYETDRFNPRYGQPLEYDLTFVDIRNGELMGGSATETVTNRTVHWSRVIHVADNRKSSEVFGAPRMQCVFNQVMDVKKMLGGSAEMFWKGGFPGYSFESTPNLNDLGADVTVGEDAIRAQMDAYQNGLQRYFALLGVQVKSLAPQAVPPTGHLEEQYKAIAIAIGVPMRVLMGSEQAVLAASQDARAWNRRINRRQDKYISPMIIRPLVSRLIWVGVLPPPGTPDDVDYTVKWPDISAPTDQDRATIATAQTGALATYVSGGVEALIPPLEYLTEILGMDLEVAQKMLESAQLHQEEMQNDQMMQQQAAMGQAEGSGMVPQGSEPVGPAGVQFGPKPPPVPPGGNKGGKKPTGNAGFDPSQPRGDAGKWSTTPGAGGTMKSSAIDVWQMAEKVRVEEASPIPRMTYKEIEELFDEDQEHSIVLDRQLVKARDQYIDDQMDRRGIDMQLPSDTDVAEEAGWSHDDIADKIDELDVQYSGDEAYNGATDRINRWLDKPSNKSKQGEDALLAIADLFKGEEEYQGLREAILGLQQDCSEATETVKAAYEASAEGDTRERIGEEFDDQEAPAIRKEYIKDWYENNRERLAGNDIDKTWMQAGDDFSYRFKTSNGSAFTIHATGDMEGGIPITSIMFSDAEGSVGITGKGGTNAHEVFSNVSAAVAGLVKQKGDDLPLLEFTAAEPSRHRLYDRIVKSVLSACPGHTAVAVNRSYSWGAPNEATRYYYVVPIGKKDELLAMIEDKRANTKGANPHRLSETETLNAKQRRQQARRTRVEILQTPSRAIVRYWTTAAAWQRGPTDNAGFDPDQVRGEAGKWSTTPGAGGTMRSSAIDIWHTAGQIKFLDVRQAGSNSIVDKLSPDQKKALDDHINEAREGHVEYGMGLGPSNIPITPEDLARTNWDAEGISESIFNSDMFDNLPEDDQVKFGELIQDWADEWDDASQPLSRRLQAMDNLISTVLDEHPSKASAMINKYISKELKPDFRKEIMDIRRDRMDKPEELKDLFRKEYDSNLRAHDTHQWVMDNVGSKMNQTWVSTSNDATGSEGTYEFKTSQGNKYTISCQARWPDKDNKLATHSIMFSDSAGNCAITGAGGAHEVFTQVSAAVISLIKRSTEMPNLVGTPVFEFTAAEPSRHRLYDRLVRTVASAFPGEFVAYAVKPGQSTRYYYIGPKAKEAALRSHIETAMNSYGKPLEAIVNAKVKIEVLPPATRGASRYWTTAAAWPGDDDGPTGNKKYGVTGGFTGMLVDTMGRKVYFVNGVRVEGNQKPKFTFKPKQKPVEPEAVEPKKYFGGKAFADWMDADDGGLEFMGNNEEATPMALFEKWKGSHTTLHDYGIFLESVEDYFKKNPNIGFDGWQDWMGNSNLPLDENAEKEYANDPDVKAEAQADADLQEKLFGIGGVAQAMEIVPAPDGSNYYGAYTTWKSHTKSGMDYAGFLGLVQKVKDIQGQGGYTPDNIKINPDTNLAEYITPTNPGFPSKISDLKIEGSAGGSTGAQWASYNGEKYVLKTGPNANHFQNELSALALYKSLDIPIPEYQLYDFGPDGKAKALLTKKVEGSLLKDYLANSSVDEVAQVKGAMREHFVADALLANWDVVGLNNENTIVTSKGVPVRIDVGGSLKHKATGGLKAKDFWKMEVTELRDMLDPSKSPKVAAIMKGVSPQQIQVQAWAILKKKDQLLAAAAKVPHESSRLVNTLQDRLKYLEAVATHGLNFTGMIVDSLGRKMYFVDGKRVAAPAGSDTTTVTPAPAPVAAPAVSPQDIQDLQNFVKQKYTLPTAKGQYSVGRNFNSGTFDEALTASDLQYEHDPASPGDAFSYGNTKAAVEAIKGLDIHTPKRSPFTMLKDKNLRGKLCTLGDTINYNNDTLPLERIDLTKLQSIYSTEMLNEKLRDVIKAGKDAALKPATVLKDGNNYYLVEGRYRLAALKLRGLHTAKVRVLDVTGKLNGIPKAPLWVDGPKGSVTKWNGIPSHVNKILGLDGTKSTATPPAPKVSKPGNGNDQNGGVNYGSYKLVHNPGPSLGVTPQANATPFVSTPITTTYSDGTPKLHNDYTSVGEKDAKKDFWKSTWLAVKDAATAGGFRAIWQGEADRRADMSNYLKHHWSSWKDKWTSDEMDHWQYYKGTGYTGMNEFLRANKGVGNSYMAKRVRSIDGSLGTAFAKGYNAPEDMVVFRNAHFNVDPQLQPGDHFMDRGFISTSLKHTIMEAPSKSKIVIRVPKGAPIGGAFPGGEEELVIPRNAVFKVVQVHKHPGDKYPPTYVFEYVPSPSKGLTAKVWNSEVHTVNQRRSISPTINVRHQEETGNGKTRTAHDRSGIRGVGKSDRPSTRGCASRPIHMDRKGHGDRKGRGHPK